MPGVRFQVPGDRGGGRCFVLQNWLKTGRKNAAIMVRYRRIEPYTIFCFIGLCRSIMGPKARQKANQKREKIELSAKTCMKVGCFFMEIDESWGKVGCFLRFFAVFEKGVSQKRFGGFAT